MKVLQGYFRSVIVLQACSSSVTVLQVCSMSLTMILILECDSVTGLPKVCDNVQFCSSNERVLQEDPGSTMQQQSSDSVTIFQGSSVLYHLDINRGLH